MNDEKRGTEDFKVGMVDESLFPKETGGGTQSIAQRLSAKEGSDIGEGSKVAEPASPLPFDINSLSKEQLQSLKAMLEATPDSIKRAKSRPLIELRTYEGKIVVDFGKAYMGVVHDVAQNRDVERPLMLVKFLGETEYTPVQWKKFMDSERVACEVLSTRTDVREISEGETFSRESGRLVEMIRKETLVWFLVKLPEGSPVETVEVEGKVANG